MDPWRVTPPRELRAELPLSRHYKEQVAAAFVALFRGEELFLVRGKQSGLWQLPGGMIEASDLSVWDAATREFFEETGSQAPLPASRLQGWFETTIQLPKTLFRGVIFVLQTEDSAEVPFAANGETCEATWKPWRCLEELDFRWPNDQTIPQIYDLAQAEDGRRPVIRRGCYSELRPSLRCGGHMRESAPTDSLPAE